MYKTYSFFYIQILFIVYFSHIDYCKVYAGDLSRQESKLNTLIDQLYSMYKDAFENEKTYITRRLFTKDGHSHYTLHVQKLKEVDGVKTHNLRLEGKSKRKDPIIYINNPVEAQMPNPFLNIDQFKSAMLERIKKQKKEFYINRNQPGNANKQLKVFKHLKVVPNKIFDVKKHVKQVTDASNNMKTRGNLKVNKKRKRKVKFSHATKSKTKPHIMTTAALPKETVLDSSETFEEKITTDGSVAVDAADGEFNTEMIAVEKITTEIPVHEEVNNETASDEKNTIQTTVNHNITAETTADDGITTATIADEVKNTVTTAAEHINTELIVNKKIIPVDEEVTNKTASDEKNTIQRTVDHEVTAETTADDGITTATIADELKNTVTTAAEDINTEMIVNKEITTEMITKEEIITEPVTTTEPRVRRTKTKQLRPYVFVEDR